MFGKILIANRGEIACRVIRTARRLAIRTVAVYSEADRDALHVREADEAWPIGPAPARESYLSVERIIAAARASGAEAIHPGYGFLAENADFAEACAAAGLVFIGPPPSAIRAMGLKAPAKALMEKAGVPLVPGYHGADQDPALLAEAAGRIGYPVLIKPSAGGGGKGMRVVEAAGDFAAALASARREAAAAFGDAAVLVEKYLTRPRHLEIQIFADTHGTIVHLFERDCSVQRRHQKIVEEAPAPGMSAERRCAMGEAAIAAARAVGYVGAGTVEFIAEGEAFYFMEMNTRLQVEHPVTEMTTGEDLVEWQLRVAAGERLPRRQEELAINGHAVEARLYAEDPARDFLPATGRLRRLRPPLAAPHLRIETGVREGDSVSIHYDPMIAKLVAWGEDRAAALRRLGRALADYEILGLATNRDFLARLAGDPEFRAGPVDTGFVARRRTALLSGAATPPAHVAAAAALALVLDQAEAAAIAAAGSGDPYSPWARGHGWRLNGATYQDLAFAGPGGHVVLRLHYRREGYRLEFEGRSIEAGASREQGGALDLSLDGVRRRFRVLREGADFTILDDGMTWRLAWLDPLAQRGGEALAAGQLAAPMPGKIVQLHVAPGRQVRRGEALLVLEAMKMEHTIAAPADGRVERVNYRLGDLVEEGAELVVLAPEAAPGEPPPDAGGRS